MKAKTKITLTGLALGIASHPKVRKFLQHLATASADKVVLVSEKATKWLKEHGIPGKSSEIVSRPVPSKPAPPKAAAPKAARKKSAPKASAKRGPRKPAKSSAA